MTRLWITQKQIAAALGISAAMVCRHRKLGMPISSVEEAIAWRLANLDPSFTIDRRLSRHPRHRAARAARIAAHSRPEPTPRDARERLDRARAEMAELDLAERRGELLRSDEVLLARQRQTAAFRARMLAIPGKIAGQFSALGKAQELDEALTAAIYEALAELAGNG